MRNTCAASRGTKNSEQGSEFTGRRLPLRRGHGQRNRLTLHGGSNNNKRRYTKFVCIDNGKRWHRHIWADQTHARDEVAPCPLCCRCTALPFAEKTAVRCSWRCRGKTHVYSPTYGCPAAVWEVCYEGSLMADRCFCPNQSRGPRVSSRASSRWVYSRLILDLLMCWHSGAFILFYWFFIFYFIFCHIWSVFYFNKH